VWHHLATAHLANLITSLQLKYVLQVSGVTYTKNLWRAAIAAALAPGVSGSGMTKVRDRERELRPTSFSITI